MPDWASCRRHEFVDRGAERLRTFSHRTHGIRMQHVRASEAGGSRISQMYQLVDARDRMSHHSGADPLDVVSCKPPLFDWSDSPAEAPITSLSSVRIERVDHRGEADVAHRGGIALAVVRHVWRQCKPDGPPVRAPALRQQ